MSQMIGIILLTLIIVASTLTIHSTITSFGLTENTGHTTNVLTNLLIEAVVPLPDEENPNKCYALDLFLRNPATDPASLRGVGIYVESGSQETPGYHLPLQGHRTVPPGELVKARFYTLGPVTGGEVLISLATRSSLSDSVKTVLDCSLAPGDAAVLRDPGDVVSLEVGGARFTVWLEEVVSGSQVFYWVWFNITVERPVPAGGIRGEILTRGLGHPEFVDFPVFHNSLDYSVGVVYQGYWVPVRGFELPVAVFWSVLG